MRSIIHMLKMVCSIFSVCFTFLHTDRSYSIGMVRKSFCSRSHENHGAFTSNSQQRGFGAAVLNVAPVFKHQFGQKMNIVHYIGRGLMVR